MVDDRKTFSLNPQRPKPVQERANGRPGQLKLMVAENLAAPDPSNYRLKRGSQERKWRLGGIQRPKPPTEGTRIWCAIRIFHRRSCCFPGIALDKAAVQCRATGNRAVLGVWKRKHRQEGNCLAARPTDPAPNHNPVMIFIMSLFSSTSMTNDRILGTQWAASNDRSQDRPIFFQLALRFRK